MTEEREKQTVLLKDWIRLGDRLWGYAYGHPRFADGAPVRTSVLVRFGDVTAETQNTIYILGAPAGQASSGSIKANFEEDA